MGGMISGVEVLVGKITVAGAGGVSVAVGVAVNSGVGVMVGVSDGVGEVVGVSVGVPVGVGVSVACMSVKGTRASNVTRSSSGVYGLSGP